jgi:hypothetical protein
MTPSMAASSSTIWLTAPSSALARRLRWMRRAANASIVCLGENDCVSMYSNGNAIIVFRMPGSEYSA